VDFAAAKLKFDRDIPGKSKCSDRCLAKLFQLSSKLFNSKLYIGVAVCHLYICRSESMRRSNSKAYRVAQKKLALFVLFASTSSNIDRFSNLFHCQNQENICNNTVTKDPTTPQICRYTTLWNVSVLQATIENKTTSVTAHRPAARRKRWTFDVKTAWCDSYFR